MAAQRILTIAEVAELLRVHPMTVYRMIRQGELPSFRVGRVLRFDAEQLEKWLRAKEQESMELHERKRKVAISAEYVSYEAGHAFSPEQMLETFALKSPALVRSFIDATEAGGKRMVCERCRAERKPITTLLLVGSGKKVKGSRKKNVMPFCRRCFANLRELASGAEMGIRAALENASKSARAEAGRAANRRRRQTLKPATKRHPAQQ